MPQPGTITPEEAIAAAKGNQAGTQYIKDEQSREDRVLKKVIIHSFEPNREGYNEYGDVAEKPGIDWWTKDYPNTGVDSHFYWWVGDKKTMERKFACMRFGDFDMERDEKRWPAMMRHICLVWDMGRPPSVVIYDEETGAKLWESNKEYRTYFMKWARHEKLGLPTTQKFAKFLPRPQSIKPPKTLIVLTHPELLELAEGMNYPVHNKWSKEQLVELCLNSPELPAKYLASEVALEAEGKEAGIPQRQ